MQYLKTIILCLLLLAIPLKGFAAARMIFCGGHGEAAHAQEMLHEHGAHHNALPPDTASSIEQSTHASHHSSDDAGYGDCHCSVCAMCCAAANMTPSNGLFGSFVEPSRTRPVSSLSILQSRFPATLERPPLAARSTRVA